MVSKISFIRIRMRPHRYLLISLLLSQPQLLLANRSVASFVNSNPSLRRRHEPSCQKHQSPYKMIGRFEPARLCFSSSSDITYCDEIMHVLRKYGFGSRLCTLTNADLSKQPFLAEIYAGSRLSICLIIRLVHSLSHSIDGSEKPPLIEVLVMNDDCLFRDKMVIDIGECVSLSHIPAYF